LPPKVSCHIQPVETVQEQKWPWASPSATCLGSAQLSQSLGIKAGK
jgi:hypothetical protein